MELIKGHLDKAVAEAKAAGREGVTTDTKALATRIDDTMHKHFGGLSQSQVLLLYQFSWTGHTSSCMHMRALFYGAPCALLCCYG